MGMTEHEHDQVQTVASEFNGLTNDRDIERVCVPVVVETEQRSARAAPVGRRASRPKYDSAKKRESGWSPCQDAKDRFPSPQEGPCGFFSLASAGLAP